MLATSTSLAPAKALRGPVAVMDVPVDDQHLAGPQLPDRQLGGDRDVVEQAEAHRAAWPGVMPRRAHGAETAAVLAGEQCPHHRTGAPGGVQRRSIGGLADVGVGIDLAAAAQAQLADEAHMLLACGSASARARCAGGRGSPLTTRPAGRVELRLDRLDPLGCVRVLGREHARVVLPRGVMVEIEHALRRRVVPEALRRTTKSHE